MLLRCCSRRGVAAVRPARRMVSTSSEGKPEAWVSASTNPWFNLAFEDHLFRTRDPDTPVCFIYRNAPCVVIGRNQNPWKELNAAAMVAAQLPMVRRRSGGGTVYHDLGNTNYSFHVPREAFDRQTHAHLVCRALNQPPIALRSSNSRLADTQKGAYVNTRNDICIRVTPNFDTSATSKTKAEADDRGYEERKVSGSAYKLVNKRAYHHGTMLLSASLGNLGAALRNDRGEHLVTKGIASVPAPVANLATAFPDRALQLTHSAFVQGVVAEFFSTYQTNRRPGNDTSATTVDENFLSHPDMNQGRWQLRENYDELKSWDWVFGQTPEFTHKVSYTDPQGDSRPSWGTFSLDIHSKHGLVLDAKLRIDAESEVQEELRHLTAALHDQRYDQLATPPPWTMEATAPMQHAPSIRDPLKDQFHAWLKVVL